MLSNDTRYSFDIIVSKVNNYGQHGQRDQYDENGQQVWLVNAMERSCEHRRIDAGILFRQ